MLSPHVTHYFQSYSREITWHIYVIIIIVNYMLILLTTIRSKKRTRQKNKHTDQFKVL